MRSFRDELQTLAIRMSAGGLLTDKDQAWLNDCMQVGGVTRRLISQEEGLDVVLVPMHAHWQQVIAEVAADFAMTLLKGEGQRIRSCDNRTAAGSSTMIPGAEHRNIVMTKCAVIL